MTVWYKKRHHQYTHFCPLKSIFMVNYSEFLVKYSNISFNIDPNACNWIIGTQESHEYAIQTVWEGFHSALE